MTKELLEQYEGNLVCDTCGYSVTKEGVYHKRVKPNYHITKCKACAWIEGHDCTEPLKYISEEQLVSLMHYILYTHEHTINYISEKYGLTMDDSVKLWRSLKTKGKKMIVNTACAQCGKEITVYPDVYMKVENNFCSHECYHEYQREHTLKGEDSPFHNRIKTNCDNCGKEIDIIPYYYNETNRFGDNHNFCCRQCYYEYRGKYYIGEKSNMFSKSPSEETKEKMRIGHARSKNVEDRLNTKIQLKINNLLDSKGIKYLREYNIEYYYIDNYLIDYNLIVEVMGDYWHGNPYRYNIDHYKMNKIQSRCIIKDKQKYSYIKFNEDIEILYLWETDINNNINKCEKLIDDYISNNGILDNYHSFNWSLDSEGELKLNDELVLPYQDIPIEEYRNMIKDD